MFKKLQFLLLIFVISQTALYAQIAKLDRGNKSTIILPSNINGNASQNVSSQKSLAVCTDKVNYVGNSYGPPIKCGSSDTTLPYIYFQIFPKFTGTVTRVDFRASKITASSPAQVLIYVIDPVFLTPVGPPIGGANLTITGGYADYGAAFATPIAVTDGFAAAVYAPNVTDSFMVACSPNNSQMFGDLSYTLDASQHLVNLPDFKDLIIRPTISFTKPTTTLSVSPTSTCKNSSVSFVGGTNITQAFFDDNMYNSLPGAFNLDFGDGSAKYFVNPTINANHSYSSTGTKATKYNFEYQGWNSLCVSSSPIQNVVVNDVAVSSFSYGTNNLILTLANNSLNAVSYNWNFGDLTTSTLQNPVHDYGTTQGAGTYVVELNSISPCGNGFQTKTIVVQPGTTTGINQTSFDESLFVYPNPASSTLNIDFEFANIENETSFFLSDVTGKTLKQKSINNLYKGTIDLDIQDLAAGTYFIKLSSDKQNVVRTFVKQ